MDQNWNKTVDLNKPVIILGAGGHAKVIIELFKANQQEVAFCVAGADSPDSCSGVKVLKGDSHLQTLRSDGYEKIFIAIGSNKIRLRMAEVVHQYGYELVNAVSPHALISPSAMLGRGIAIMAGVVVNAESKINNLAIINTGATIDHECCIGTAAHIATKATLAGNVHIGEGALLGVGCQVIPGKKVGEWATVGAGAVVVSDLPQHSKAVGVPARVISFQ